MANVALSAKNVGDTIYIKESGTRQPYLIVHKGSPSTAYSGFDNGVVVLRTAIHSKGVYDSSNNDYANSDLHSWGNNTFLNTIDSEIRNQIMSVKIPYRRGTSGSSVSSGANGLQCKVFFLSTKEVDSTESYSPNEGAVFSYFKGGGNSKRIARYNGQADYWWLRSPDLDYVNDYAYRVDSDGNVDDDRWDVADSYGRRPAFVLPSSLFVSDDGDVVTNIPPTAPGSINVNSVVAGGTTTITITAASDSDGTIENYQYEHSIDGAAYQTLGIQAGLTFNDEIQTSWGTVQYRVCAIDNMGAKGPYVESQKYTVQSGYVTIGGPSPSMGTKDQPFTFEATIGVSGLTGITGIHVRAWVDSYLSYDDSVNQGAKVSFEVDTRSMSAGSHTIRVIAEHDTVLSAQQDYTFTISEMDIPEGGRAEQFEDEYGTAIFPVTMAKNVISPNGTSIQTEIEKLRVQHHGTTGQLEHVDAVTGTASYKLTREAGTTYACTLFTQVATGTSNPMLCFSIPSSFNGNVTLGSVGSVKVESASITFTIPTTAVLNISKYTLESPIA